MKSKKHYELVKEWEERNGGIGGLQSPLKIPDYIPFDPHLYIDSVNNFLTKEKNKMTQETTSPTPAETGTETLTFCDAIVAILGGKKVRKADWPDEQYYGLLRQDILMLHKPDGKFYKWIVNKRDMEGVDWIILDK